MYDSHLHFITKEMFDDISARAEKSYPGFSRTLMENAKHLVDEIFLEYLSNTSTLEMSQLWLSEMDKHGIDKVVFFPISERMDDLREFLSYSPKRFRGYAYLNDPLATDAPDRLKKYVTEYGMKGLKLYPCLQLFHAYDERLFPLYEEAESLNIPITFHLGITHAPVSDYRYTNPLDLQLPLKLFPKLNIIIAHFGAGFFREALMLKFHADNLYLDSSGTNNWREYTPENMELKNLFKRSIEVFGIEKILFGTDTVMRPDAGYRSAIMNLQKGIIEELLPDGNDAERILHTNALELYS